MTEEQMKKLCYVITFVIALTYYVTVAILQALKPKAIMLYHKERISQSDTYVLTLLTLENTYATVSIWGREMIAEFSPSKAWETAITLASGYVTRWRQHDR
jgi:hypothetical protein